MIDSLSQLQALFLPRLLGPLVLIQAQSDGVVFFMLFYALSKSVDSTVFDDENCPQDKSVGNCHLIIGFGVRAGIEPGRCCGSVFGIHTHP